MNIQKPFCTEIHYTNLQISADTYSIIHKQENGSSSDIDNHTFQKNKKILKGTIAPKSDTNFCLEFQH